MKTDFLAIGDIVIDAFIRLKEAEVRCDENKMNCKLCLNFGDKVPYEYVEVIKAVGNSANASVSAARLGLSSSLLTYVGNDQSGKDCIEELEKNNVSTKYVRKEDGKITNYHYVLWYDVDRTILVKHETFSYDLGDVEPPKWIYLSSVGENSLDFHMQIADYLEKNPEVNLAFQPGTYQMKFGTEALARIYKETEIFVCNVEESQRILKRDDTRDLPILMSEMMKLGPKIVIITDGIEGAYAYDGKDMWFMPVYPHTPYERTGAGDSFASTVVSAIAMGKTLEEALMWGPINSQSVVQQVGAQKGLLSREKLEEFLTKAPVDYKPRKI
jgi:sugar/nucleoside kinase (ribokinase family)